MEGTAFKVAVRLRPLLDKERRESAVQCVSVELEHNAVIISKPTDRRRQIEVDDFTGLVKADTQQQNFFFDIVFGPSCTQEDIYATCARHIILSVLEGYNGSIIAYGQTGTGKSYTIEGGNDDTCRGLIPRSSEEIFSYIENTANTREKFLVRVSFLEIYNEKISDLLEPNNTNLRIREDGSGGMYVDQLSEHLVKTTKDIKALIKKGTQLRTTAATRSNIESSRSHAIFTIIVEHSQSTDDGGTVVTIGKLRLADLAGSERLDVDSQSQRQAETRYINVSLLTFGKVVMQLTTTSTNAHIPYRDSKLTKILQDSLGGNCKTTMITTISPTAASYTESLNSLKFAKRAKHVKNKAVINKDMSQKALLSSYQQEIKQLREQLKMQGGPGQLSADDLIKMEKEKDMANQQKDKVMSELEHQKTLYDKAEKEKLEYKKRIAQLEAKLLHGGTQQASSGEDLQKVLEVEREKIKEDTKQEYEKMMAQIEREKERLKKDKEEIEKEKKRISKMKSQMPPSGASGSEAVFTKVPLGVTSLPKRSSLPVVRPLATPQRYTPPNAQIRMPGAQSFGHSTPGGGLTSRGVIPSRKPSTNQTSSPSHASSITDALVNYYQELAHPTEGIPCQYLSSGQQIFSGQDAVKWFMGNMEGVTTTEQAIGVGSSLINCGLISDLQQPGTATDYQFNVSSLYQFRNPIATNIYGAPDSRPISAFSTLSLATNNKQAILQQPRAGSLPAVHMAGYNPSDYNLSGGLDSSSHGTLSLSSSVTTLQLPSSSATTDDIINSNGLEYNNPTGLHIACISGDGEGIKALATSININTPDDGGYTPLMYAAVGNQPKCCNLLLKNYKADLNVKNRNMNTALMLAGLKGHHEVVKILLKHRADVTLTDANGNNVFHMVVTDPTYIKCLQNLIKYSTTNVIGPLNERNNLNQTPLHIAVQYHAHDMMATLLKAKCDLGVSDDQGKTALHYAVAQGCKECVQTILSIAPNEVNLVDIKGMSALHIATEMGYIELVKLLLNSKSCDVNLADDNGQTALHIATITNNHQIIKLLVLKAGINRSIKDRNGMTPMDYAQEKGLVECCNALK